MGTLLPGQGPARKGPGGPLFGLAGGALAPHLSAVVFGLRAVAMKLGQAFWIWMGLKPANWSSTWNNLGVQP